MNDPAIDLDAEGVGRGPTVPRGWSRDPAVWKIGLANARAVLGASHEPPEVSAKIGGRP